MNRPLGMAAAEAAAATMCDVAAREGEHGKNTLPPSFPAYKCTGCGLWWAVYGVASARVAKRSKQRARAAERAPGEAGCWFSAR